MTLILGADCQIISSSAGCVELLRIDSQDESSKKPIGEGKQTSLPQNRCRKITEDSLNHTRAETCHEI